MNWNQVLEELNELVSELEGMTVIAGLLEQACGQTGKPRECSLMFFIEKSLDRMCEKTKEISEMVGEEILCMRV